MRKIYHEWHAVTISVFLLDEHETVRCGIAQLLVTEGRHPGRRGGE